MRGLVFARCANDWAAAAQEFADGGLLGEALIRQAPVRPVQADTTTAKPQAKPAEEAGAANAAGAADAKRTGIASVEPKKPASTKTMARNLVGGKERQAQQALHNLLKLADISDDPANVQAVADTIRRKEFAPYTAKKINEAVIDFYKNHAQTETAQENAPIINALGNVNRSLPPEQRPFKPRWQREWRTLY